MYRSVCFGACPVYSLTIYGNGTVVYEGEMYVNVTGKQTSEISQEKIQEIVDEFYRIDYLSLDDVYDEPISDIPHTITSIRINGKYKSIYNRAGAPKELKELENKIDEIIMNELENIRLIKNVKRREKRYLKLSKALVDYDKGMISLTWKIRKKLGVLDYI